MKKDIVLFLLVAFRGHARTVDQSDFDGREFQALVNRGLFDGAWNQTYSFFNASFDYAVHARLSQALRDGLSRMSRVPPAHLYVPDRPHCDKAHFEGVAVAADVVAAFPGGASQRMFGAEFAQKLSALSSVATGPTSVGGLSAKVLSSVSLGTAMGIVQSVVAGAVHVVPPLIPPPAWNNQPLTCVPMATGHNCFGAVSHPITMADFVLADVTDSIVEGMLDSFPATYAQKVGKTSDAMYKACGQAYFSMHCSSLFPRCTAPQSRDDPIPAVGRVPMCLHMCVLPLVMCPGLWIGDIIGTCSMVSLPPMCTQSLFWMTRKIPPQYASVDEARPFPRTCPASDEDLDGAEDVNLYDTGDLAPAGHLSVSSSSRSSGPQD